MILTRVRSSRRGGPGECRAGKVWDKCRGRPPWNETGLRERAHDNETMRRKHAREGESIVSVVPALPGLKMAESLPQWLPRTLEEVHV